MPTASPTARSHLRRDLWCAVAVVVIAAAVRYPRLDQGLWYDEMTTLVAYVQQPWSTVLAAGPGQYVPNNHVLHTVLAKGAYPAVTDGPPREAMLRLPSWAAASLLPVAVAWPLRRRSPWAAGAVALAVALNPWLVALGSEARGYSLMLLLGVIATNLLPTAAASRSRVAGYATAVAAAVYTVPLAVLLVPAHAAAVVAVRRDALRRWAAGAVAAVTLAVLLYLPMARGLLSYYRNPYPATSTYPRFLDSLPRHALAGQRLPLRVDDPLQPPPLGRPPEPLSAAVFWAVPVLATVVGSVLGWRRPDARPLVATLAAVTLLGVLLPLAVPAAAEVRFDAWAAPWFCLAVVLLLAASAGAGTAYGRTVAVAGLAVLLVQSARWDADAEPNQPIREAMQWADRHAPAGRPVVVAGVGATEAVDCYAGDVPHHGVLAAPTNAMFRRATADVADRTGGRLPWVVVPFERLARDRDPRGTWAELATSGRYVRVARLPGRLVPVAVYAPRADVAPAAGPAVTRR